MASAWRGYKLFKWRFRLLCLHFQGNTNNCDVYVLSLVVVVAMVEAKVVVDGVVVVVHCAVASNCLISLCSVSC